MPFKSLCFLSFFSLWAFIGQPQAQIDSAAAITAFPKQDWFSETPFFCPFDPNYLLLDGRVFHISKRRFLSPDSTYVNTCYPTGASIEQYTPDPEAEPRYHWWEPDPEATDYYWAADEGNDTLVLWRYDRRTDRQDSFLITSVNHHGFEIAWGKPGIWVSDHWNLMLLDRHSGAVLRRIERPDRDSGSFVSLYPWGDSVLVNEHWLYQPNSNSYKIFSPLSSDLKECNAPGNVEFKGTVCGSMVQEKNDYTYYLTSPYSPSIRLSFDLGCCVHDYLLAVNPPFVWFRLPEKLMSINYETGDSVVYPGPTGYRLNGNQDGRFLGFLEPRGLIFFDKANCQFRILDLPYGYKQPRYFTSDQRYIYLTYEDRWEMVDFSHLSLAFRRSSVLEEYQQFEQDWTNLRKDQPEAFYVQYRIYLQLLDRYRNTQNPKIIETWPRLKGSIHYALFSASDSLMERIAVEYAADAFDPSVLGDIALGLFNYWGYLGDLPAMLHLLQVPDYEAYFDEHSQSAGYLMPVVRVTQYRLDSIAALTQAPDKSLYALGRVWWDYCYNKRSFGYKFMEDPRNHFEQSYAYYRRLIEQYPQSTWADNARYDMLYFVDYQPCCTDDLTPPGNIQQAYQLFGQFLKDYPDSDRRPDVLLRMAKIIQSGIEDGNEQPVSKDSMAAYLQIIAREYPDFASTSDDYRKLAAELLTKAWSSQWKLLIAADRPTYQLADTIRFYVRLYNQSDRPQTLEASFLQRWQAGLHLHINQVPEQGCAELWGRFPLLPGTTPRAGPSITVQPGASYQETFLMERTALNENYKPNPFELAAGHTFTYFLEFRHPVSYWLYLSVAARGELKIR